MSTRFNASRRQLFVSSACAVVSFALAGGAHAFDAKSTAPVNVDAKGVALRGHDPVSYFAAGKPATGSAAHQSTFDGATYQFASADNKATFDKDPAKYAPQYGGFCAYAAANGYKADADPKAWSIVDGRLFVNYNAAVAKTWQGSSAKFIRDADAKWPALKSALPKS
jgi:YHS domain-containing protein